MKRLIITIFLLLPLIAAVAEDRKLTYTTSVAEADGDPVVWNPYQIKFNNGSVTDNSDGTVSINVTAGGVADADYGDITVSSGVWGIDADTVTLTTDTTGNYVASITNGTGISGGDGGSEGAALTLSFVSTEIKTTTWGDNSDADIAWTFDASSNDGVFSWMEDENYFQLSNGLMMGAQLLYFQDSNNYIYSSSAPGIDLVTNSGVVTHYASGLTTVAPTNTDITQTFTATTNSGEYKWMEDEDYFEFSDRILTNGGLTLKTTAGDVTLSNAGETEVDTTQRQLAWHDGTAEIAIPAIEIAQGTFDLAAQWDVDPDLWLVDLHSDRFPDGIVITAWYVDCTVADPATELDANLRYCDAVGGAAFPGANETLIDVIDTTTGNSSETDMSNSDLGSGTIPTGKSIYIDLDADPTDGTTQYHVRIHYYIPES